MAHFKLYSFYNNNALMNKQTAFEFPRVPSLTFLTNPVLQRYDFKRSLSQEKLPHMIPTLIHELVEKINNEQMMGRFMTAWNIPVNNLKLKSFINQIKDSNHLLIKKTDQ